MRTHQRSVVLATLLLSAGMTLAQAQTAATVVYNFNARYPGPCTALTAGPDGLLYGSTSGVGRNVGEIFRIDPLGPVGNFTVLRALPPDGSEGYVLGPLLLAPDGNFYTTATSGSAANQGAILRITPAGAVTVIHSFFQENVAEKGASPAGGLTLGPDGLMYGVTLSGTDSRGKLFRISTSGAYTLLHSFSGGANGSSPRGPLVLMPDGFLYGLSLGGMYRFGVDGTFTLLTTDVNESKPYSGPSAGTDGHLYFTIQTGGAAERGKVVRMTTGGAKSTVYEFPTGSASDPAFPAGGVFEAADGLLYGSTPYLGLGHTARGFLYAVSKAGTLVRVVAPPAGATFGDAGTPHITQTADGSLFVSTCAALLRFRAPDDLTVWRLFPSTGHDPRGALTEGSDGHLYGTTSQGGHNDAGTVFRLTRGGELTTLVSMDATNAGPRNGIARADDGSIFGTSSMRTLFKLSSANVLSTVTTFPEPLSVQVPFDSALVEASDGGIYGVTSHGAPGTDCGTFFRLQPSSGALTRIAVFDGVRSCHPIGPLVRGDDGFLYGELWRPFSTHNQTPPEFFRLGLDGSITYLPNRPDALIDPLMLRTRDGTVFRVRSSSGPLLGGQILQDAPSLAANASTLAFAATVGGSGFLVSSPPQVVRLTQGGVGTVTWTIAANQPWLSVTPTSGAGSDSFTVGVQHVAGMPTSGVLTGTVAITPTGASTTSVVIPVTLTLVPFGTSTVPVGLVDTPLNNAVVNGSIGVTGWAVDDLGVRAVRIFRDAGGAEPAGTLVFIGNAVMVEGARPDVAAAFPNLPGSAHAGWGYLLLTNMLPGQGNGTFRLHAVAEDVEGNTTLLGSRTIVADNANATAPFGAIDTPGQGDVVSGANYANFGWVLARGTRRADPPGGGSVVVLIDGVPVGSPGGWTGRSDLSALFPQTQYEGVTSALGVFSIDTTSLSNGVHTIAWVVTDNQGGAAGIGSRYFIVQNGAASGTAVTAATSALGAAAAAEDHTAVRGRLGYDAGPLQTFPQERQSTLVRAAQLQRIELHLGPDEAFARHGRRFTGYLRVGDELRPLPFGARIDPATGAFTWQPGVGFLGAYDFTFVQWIGAFSAARQDVRIVLEPASR